MDFAADDVGVSELVVRALLWLGIVLASLTLLRAIMASGYTPPPDDPAAGGEKRAVLDQLRDGSSHHAQKKGKRVTVTTPSEAASAPEFEPGVRVRVVDEDHPSYNMEGNVVSAAADGLVSVRLSRGRGRVQVDRSRVKKLPTVFIPYTVQGAGKAERHVAGVDPFCTVSGLRAAIGEELKLEPFQFRLINRGTLIDRTKTDLAAHAHHLKDAGGVTVYINKASLVPGYKPPAAERPDKADALFASLNRQSEELEERILGEAQVPYGVVEVNSIAELTDLLGRQEKVIVDFYAPWCGPCRSIAPVFNTLASTYSGKGGVAFVKIDADKHRSPRYAVASFPTFIAFRRGDAVARMNGASAANLSNFVSQVSAM